MKLVVRKLSNHSCVVALKLHTFSTQITLDIFLFMLKLWSPTVITCRHTYPSYSFLSPCCCMCLQELKSLLEKGGNPNEIEPTTNVSLLHWAAEKGCTDAVRLLVKFMADINIEDEGGTTPLMRACRKDHFDIVEILLKWWDICVASYVAWSVMVLH